MKKIILFDTAIATSNVGDEIIFESVKKGLHSIISNAAIYRMGTHVQNYSSFQMFLHKYIYSDKKIKSINEEATFKFICGTNLLVDNLFRLRAQFMLNTSNSSLYKEAILVGVGRTKDYKRFKNKYTENLYKKTLSHSFKHSVRDEETKNVLESIGISCINTGCPTLWEFTPEKCKKIPINKAINVIFSVSGYAPQRDPNNDKLMIDILKKNYKQLYAWIQTAADEEYLMELIDIKESNIKCIYSLEEFKHILVNKNVDYIGTRLHGGIFSMQNNVRTLIVSIDERAQGFHDSNNIPIIKRENMSDLESILKGPIITKIKLNKKGIEEFLNQFI